MPEPTEIKTERLLLRPFRLKDVDDVYAYAKEPEFSRFLPLPSPYEYIHAETYVAASFLTAWNVQPRFAISFDGRVIGGINIRIDPASQTAELGYGIASAHWGKGFTVEAAAAVIDWSFKNFDIAKVSARADILNRQSWRVMEKLGMKREGILRSQEPPNPVTPDERVDMVHYGILREEWERQTVR
ncbi:MAG: GNAT family N-acetyltransferase [Dehalococcoidia bacterium]|nr:GNAT family N-acetyltransferase [Dehalococcoidia bacterium]